MKRLSIVIMALLLLGLCSCGTAAEAEPESTDPVEQVEQESVEQVVYEDQYIKAVFNGINALPMVEGMSAINMTFTNLSEQKITILPMDSSVNDMMVLYTSGFPATLQGGKQIKYVMSFNNETADISDYTEVTKLEFSLSVNDADFHEISRSEILTINVN